MCLCYIAKSSVMLWYLDEVLLWIPPRPLDNNCLFHTTACRKDERGKEPETSKSAVKTGQDTTKTQGCTAAGLQPAQESPLLKF